ncbi:MAG: nucleotidyltransferase family protein [Frankiales bacterium]|nr:nucleotidyltransferase family protein [Frankiales bacterium]
MPKALVELDGELLVDRAARVASAAGCDPVVVVLGAEASRVVSAARLEHAVVVVNDDWSTGMSSSLRCGLAALTDLPAGSAIVLLVDQPRVTPDVVRRLAETWRKARPSAVVATYSGEPRNPVLLDRAVWSDLAASVSGDTGAREWLRGHADLIATVACDDLGSAVDIDTRADLAQLQEETR